MHIEIELWIMASDNSMTSKGEILHFDRCDDRLMVILRQD
jgi:hypothetical protein